MDAFKVATRIEPGGELHLSELPFSAGDEVEVIVLRQERKLNGDRYPLRGRPLRYDRPTEPVVEGF